MDPNTTNSLGNFFENLRNFDIFGFFKNIFNFIFNLFNPNSDLAGIWVTVKAILGGVAVFFFFVIAYCIVRLTEIRRKEKAFLKQKIEEYARKHSESETGEKETFKNPKWQKVLELLFSENEGDWKLAIMEADLLLDTLMIELGFRGDSLGERLKNANQDSFKNLTFAWEVHNIRNKIAHEGSDFVISKHEARRIISLYEEIFRPYGFI